MANTNAISQMTRAANQVSTGKTTGKESTPEESFQGMLDKVSGTEAKAPDSKETAGGGQDKTDTDAPISKEEPAPDTKAALQPDLAALLIQSMVGDVSSNQGSTAADNQTGSVETTVTQAVALPTVETQVPEKMTSVPITGTISEATGTAGTTGSVGTTGTAGTTSGTAGTTGTTSETLAAPKSYGQAQVETKQEKTTEVPVMADSKTEGKIEPKAEEVKTSTAAETVTKESTKAPLPTVSEGAATAGNQSGKAIVLEQMSQQQQPQQQTGNQEQPAAASVETLKDTETVPAEKPTVVAEVKKDIEKTMAAPEPVTVKNAPVQDTEVVKIKVAEPFKQVDSNLMNQISDKVKDTVVLGKDELVIQLTPEHLGKIAIKISMMDDGIKVVLNCDNLKTQNLLADKAAGIGKIVEDNMNSPVTVEVKDDSYWNQQKNATDQHNNHSRQQEEQEKQSQEDTEVFIQQLRLGLGGQLTAS